ncbi:MAG: glycosyltransferase [Anaerolineales bacterium]|nr:glycosyltransferase [Anaerolineales bacterium]
MNVLFLTQVLPYPLDAGPKVRAYYVLRHLAQGHRVTLASFVRPSDSPTALAHLREVCAEVITSPMPRARWRDALAVGRSALRGEPVLIARDWAPAMAGRLREVAAAQRFDVIHADQVWMAPYALAAHAAAPAAPRLVLDQHNAVYLIPQRLTHAARGLRRLFWRREAALMARYETRTCLAFDQVVTVSDPDQQALLALYPQPPRPAFPPPIPICIDAQAAPSAAPAADSPGLLFLGGMHWPPNAEGVRWFVREALPAVQAQVPGAVFYAIGRQPPADVTAQAGVVAPGYVDDPTAYWAKSQVFVVPLLAGGGMRVKILDAWARGVPVVSTTIGAEGLAYRDGVNLLIGDTPAALAEAVARVLSDPALAARLAEAGRRTALTHYDWRVIYSAWDAVYQPAAEVGAA